MSFISFFKTSLRNQAQLAAVFRYLDVDHSGAIDRQEFMSGIKVLNQRLASGGGSSSGNAAALIDNPGELFDVMDLDNNGSIDMNEFCECFRITEVGGD